MNVFDNDNNKANLDNSERKENMESVNTMEPAISPDIVMSLDKYSDTDFITKPGLAAAFGCTERTLQRMVERFEVPPSIYLAGRKVWIVGKLRAWIAKAAERQEEEAVKAAGRLRVFDK